MPPPQDAALSSLIAEARRRLRAGDWAGVEALCVRILDTQPRHPEAFHLGGIAAWRAGRFEDGLRRLEGAALFAPDEPAVHLDRGRALAEAGRRNEALAALRTATILDPTLAEAHFALAEVLRAVGNLAEAIDEYTLAVRGRPDAAAHWTGLGHALLAVGETVEAAAAFKRGRDLTGERTA